MINLLFCGNYKVYDGILLALLSMTRYTKSEMCIHIITADLTDISPEYKPITQEQCRNLESIIQKVNKSNSIKRIMVGKDFKDWVQKSINQMSVYTPFALLRLFADRIDEIPAKILYFDTDIMFSGDISPLYNTDISDYELGVVLDRYGQWCIDYNYFNTGMLLINKSNIIKTRLFERTLDMCLTKKMAFPDQTALNKCVDKTLYLPRKYNEQGEPKNDTVVQHFSKRIKWLPFFHTRNYKPWHIDMVHKKYKWHKFDDIYEEYLKIKNDNK